MLELGEIGCWSVVTEKKKEKEKEKQKIKIRRGEKKGERERREKKKDWLVNIKTRTLPRIKRDPGARTAFGFCCRYKADRESLYLRP